MAQLYNSITGIYQEATAKTSNYTATADETIFVDATSGDVDITLPSAATDAHVTVVRIDDSANDVTILRAGSDTIGVSGTSLPLPDKYNAYQLRANVNSWTIHAAALDANIKPFPTITDASDTITKEYLDDELEDVSASVVDASAGAKGIIQLAGDLAGVGSTAASPVLKNVAKVFNVKDYGAVGDGVASDATAINNAITAANTAGGGIVDFPKGTYLADQRIVPKSNVTLRGVGSGTVIKRNANDQTIVRVSGAMDNFHVVDMTFEGSVNSFPTVPTRARTTSGVGSQYAIYITGNGDPGTPGAGTVTNISITNCTFKNHSQLPVRFAGIKGSLKVTGCDFVNNLDPGFIFNEEVILIGNHSMYGADNGFSLSRGNKKVICVGNTIEGCAYEGIFIGGFDINNDGDLANIGPDHLVVTGNVIKNVGLNGIFAAAAPSAAVISGNTIDLGHYRGPVDQTTDINSIGIFVAGYPFPYTTPTAYAENIIVSSNLVKNAARAGVEVSAAKRVKVEGNMFVDIGTQFLADGTTAVSSTEVTSNAGVLIRSATCSDIVVRNNDTIDTRGTPYTNYAVVPYTAVALAATTRFEYSNNRMVNCRNAFNLLEWSPQAKNIAGAASQMWMSGINDAHGNRVVTVTDNASVTSIFLNVQAAVTGQAMAFRSGTFSGTGDAPILFIAQDAGYIALRAGTNSTSVFQVRRADSVVSNSLVIGDTTNNRWGINTSTPTRELDVVGASRFQAILGASTMAPTITEGTGMGTGPTSVSVAGSNTAGVVTFTTGTSCANNATVFTLNFGGPKTTIAAGSDGQVLPQGTINVASVAGFKPFGTFVVNGTDTVTYTGLGTNLTSFTGCTGGTLTMSTGMTVEGPLLYPNVPILTITGVNPAAGVLSGAASVYWDAASSSSAGAVVKVANTALADSTTYAFAYQVIG